MSRPSTDDCQGFKVFNIESGVSLPQRKGRTQPLYGHVGGPGRPQSTATGPPSPTSPRDLWSRPSTSDKSLLVHENDRKGESPRTTPVRGDTVKTGNGPRRGLGVPIFTGTTSDSNNPNPDPDRTSGVSPSGESTCERRYRSRLFTPSGNDLPGNDLPERPPRESVGTSYGSKESGIRSGTRTRTESLSWVLSRTV